MLITINGVQSEIFDTSIRGLISARNLPDDAIIIELNGTIVTRELWESTSLNPDDNLEIIRIIGGG